MHLWCSCHVEDWNNLRYHFRPEIERNVGDNRKEQYACSSTKCQSNSMTAIKFSRIFLLLQKWDWNYIFGTHCVSSIFILSLLHLSLGIRSF